MFDLSLAELGLIVVVAVVFIGPKELPVVVRTVAKGMRAMRGVYNELRQAFDELSRESGLKDAAKEFDQEVRMIKGDDGNWYESYDMGKLSSSSQEKNHG